jgi:membrane glycosyltransferase
MHPVHRAVFLTGVMSYLSAPLWFMFLALSTALQVVHVDGTAVLPATASAVPVWPQWRPELAIAVCLNHGAAVPAEVAEYFADLV